MHVAAKSGMRRDVNIIFNDAFMVDACAGIDYAVVANAGVRLDYGALHHDSPNTYPYSRGNQGVRMYGPGIGDTVSFGDLFPNYVGTD